MALHDSILVGNVTPVLSRLLFVDLLLVLHFFQRNFLQVLNGLLVALPTAFTEASKVISLISKDVLFLDLVLIVGLFLACLVGLYLSVGILRGDFSLQLGEIFLAKGYSMAVGRLELRRLDLFLL